MASTGHVGPLPLAWRWEDHRAVPVILLPGSSVSRVVQGVTRTGAIGPWDFLPIPNLSVVRPPLNAQPAPGIAPAQNSGGISRTQPRRARSSHLRHRRGWMARSETRFGPSAWSRRSRTCASLRDARATHRVAERISSPAGACQRYPTTMGKAGSTMWRRPAPVVKTKL
jgi:hypothetical protein